ncbi:4'-phosphopantetheinyl transferase family protein [Actinacidiphila glaucinigra]|uniref:4'-phosphopantetheinyl transferase EntD (Siderophore biosynthesis) n=1 Tax=Actinacidiphila glaucinigra TaxID=235986 RepID=A0A239IVX1_9ACTN|nr:4'-phosphopantetheinyl transferase superfamily protein [Actinacidiphila glaucinigra]SNS97780.1 4'-phosphopantetheinyl transferase EntD (siderophore biosynthesis) [Actinacidiphila glaucinigra]
MIEALLPGVAATGEAFGPDGSATLYPEEAALVARTPDRRREEFSTVRACARRALAALGLPPAPVLPGVRNVPQWPAGVVGSMTHCEGYRAAALARDTDLAMIGIDAEPDLPLPGGVLESIALPGELAWVRAGGSRSRVNRDRLLFSAKEAVYKTWYPLMRTELDFDDADITFVEDGTSARPHGTFSARLLRPRRAPDGRLVERFSGRWLADRGIVVTAIAFPAVKAAERKSGPDTVRYQGG